MALMLFLMGLMVLVPLLEAQPDKKDFGKRGFGFGGKGPMMGQERQLVKQFDKDGDGKLNQEERRAARDFLKKDGGGFRGPGGFGKGPGGPGGKGPGGRGFSPAGFMTKPLLEALDANEDEQVTREELLAGIRTFFKDSADKETLDEAQLAEGLNRILPRPEFPGGRPGFGPGGPGGFGPGTFLAGGIMKRVHDGKKDTVTLEELLTTAEAVFKEADKNNDGKLDERELEAGLTALLPPPPGFGPGGPGGKGPGGPGGNGPGGPGGFGRKTEPAKPGPRVSPTEVKTFPDAPLYEPTVVRTLFLEFENDDWEAELADFYRTDVEIPARLTVDGKTYPNVGVNFRGMSSYFTVSPGHKRSFKISIDFDDPKQRLHGYKTLNLLNSHSDPTFMSTVLFSRIARDYIPAPKANYVKVVINGESWGIYVNAQQFNKDFITDFYDGSKGTRWKVKGSPGGGGGLDYLGDNLEAYKARYQMKSSDGDKEWQALVELCRVLNKTPLDQLEEALTPILDLDGVLWFLALDVALINNDGYWIRASDYTLFRDRQGKFHIIPHDINETFQPAMGMGMGGMGGFGPGGFGKGPGGPGAGPRSSGIELDPLVGLDDPRKPLRSRLLAVPSLRERYLKNVRTIAEDWLDWNKLGPVVAQNRELIEKEIELDTRKLTSLTAFQTATADSARPGSAMSLRSFAEQRRRYLLNHPEIKKLR